VCNNIITGMNIQIVYANVGAINNRQSQIIGAAYQLVCQSELRFQVCQQHCAMTAHTALCGVCCHGIESFVTVTLMSTQPCIPPGLLNRVPASAGVRAGMRPLPGGR